MVNTAYETVQPGLVRLRSTPVDFTKIAEDAIRTVDMLAQADFNHADYLTQGEYSFADIAATANAPANAPANPGKLIVELIEATNSYDMTLVNVFTGEAWKQGYPLPSGPHGGWTKFEGSELSSNYTNTSVLPLTARISVTGDRIPDLAALTDGPGGLTGVGAINSTEMPTGSGQHLRTIRDIGTGDVYSNYYNGTVWQGWQKNASADAVTTIPPASVAFDPGSLNPGAAEELEVAFGGALQGDGFSVASEADIGAPANGFMQATANWSRDGFVRIVVRNNDSVPHDLPAAQWHIFKENSQLPSPITGTVVARTFAQISDQADSINQAALKTREITVYITDRDVYVRPGSSLTPTGPWKEAGSTVDYVTPS